MKHGLLGAALLAATLVLTSLTLLDTSGPSAATDKGITLMDHNPDPDTGTDLFYFLRLRKTGSLVPETTEDLSYDALPMAEVFHKARRNAQGQIIYEELWKRVRSPAPEDLLIDGQPVSALDPARIGLDLKSQTPQFFVLNADTRTYDQVDYAATEGQTDFLRLRLRKNLLDEGLFISAELIAQRLDSNRAYEYREDGGLAMITEWSRATEFKREDRVFRD